MKAFFKANYTQYFLGAEGRRCLQGAIPWSTLLLLLLSNLVTAQSTITQTVMDQPSADSIVQSVRDRDDGFSYSSEVTLRLMDGSAIHESKNTRERHFYLLQKDREQGEERAFMTFHRPADVRGVSFLVASYNEAQSRADDQWMYFPAFRKIRRLGANDKRGSFMGSVFTYYDLDKVRVSDYHNRLLGDAIIDQRPVWHIERTPVSQAVINKSGYAKHHIWVDKERHLILRQHYYNAKGLVFKQQQAFDIEKVQGIWTITRTLATDLEKHKQSEMRFANTVYNLDIRDGKISQRALRRGIQLADMPRP